MFFGSAINNFGVQAILQALVEWAPPPQPRDGRPSASSSRPKAPFTRLRVQDPGEHGSAAPRPHRVRPRLLGPLQPAMKVRHLRTGREMKLGNALTFMANERVASEDAVAGDIIGIHNHGQLQIGDTLTEGEALGIQRASRISRRSSSASRGRAIRSRRSSCRRACSSSARKARSRCSRSSHTNTLAARRRRPAAVRGRRAAARERIQGRRDLRNGQHLDRALAHVSRRHRSAELRARAGGRTGHRRRRQPGIPRDEQVQPAGDDRSAGRKSAFTRRASTASGSSERGGRGVAEPRPEGDRARRRAIERGRHVMHRTALHPKEAEARRMTGARVASRRKFRTPVALALANRSAQASVQYRRASSNMGSRHPVPLGDQHGTRRNI